MSVKITRVTTILTAPVGINLVVVRIDTNQPGLYGLGCATFAYRALTVKSLFDDYVGPLLIGRLAPGREDREIGRICTELRGGGLSHRRDHEQ